MRGVFCGTILIMDLIHAAVLGIVEGITEFLPVSSTGHLVVAARLLGIPNTDFVKSFEIAIQLGAILAVVVLYGVRAFRDREIFKKIIAAFIPTAFVGFALYKIIKTFFLGNISVISWTLLLGGVAMLFFEYWVEKRGRVEKTVKEMTYRDAISIGLFQSLAVVPGVSRSAATIIGGMFSGISRETIVVFSFLLAVPTMLAATGYDLLKSFPSFGAADIAPLAVGFSVSFIVALLAVRWFTSFVSKHTFKPFAWYRIVLGLALVIFGVR